MRVEKSGHGPGQGRSREVLPDYVTINGLIDSFHDWKKDKNAFTRLSMSNACVNALYLDVGTSKEKKCIRKIASTLCGWEMIDCGKTLENDVKALTLVTVNSRLRGFGPISEGAIGRCVRSNPPINIESLSES